MNEGVSTGIPSPEIRPEMGDKNAGIANEVKPSSTPAAKEDNAKSGYKDRFWGGLSDQGEKQAQQLRTALEGRGITLTEGTKIPQRVIEEVMSGMDIKANFWQAMIAPSLLNAASGGLKAEWDNGDDGSFYTLVKPPEEPTR
jgi:hypothetical protein